MSGAETRSIEDLPEVPRRVIRALLVLGLPAISVDEVAAALNVAKPEARAAVAWSIKAGWLTAARTGRYALAITPRGLSADPGDGFDPEELRRRLGEYLLGGVRAALRTSGGLSGPPADDSANGIPDVRFVDANDAATWLVDHQENLLAAIRNGAQHGPYEHAALLAAEVWKAALEVADSQWWHELSRWGEEAAIRWQNPPLLATLVGHSASFLRRAKNIRAAERQLVRALSIGRRLRDREIAVTALHSLSELYQEWGRRHLVLDAELELLAWQRRAGTALDVARARARVASIMLAVGRASSAVEHLLQAEQELAGLDEAAATEHAEVLIMLGRAHWQLGATGTARRYFSHALTIVVERNPAAANQVRELLRTEDGQPLPSRSPAGEQMQQRTGQLDEGD